MEIGFCRQELPFLLEEVGEWDGFAVVLEKIECAGGVVECGGGSPQLRPHQPKVWVWLQRPTHLHLTGRLVKGLGDLHRMECFDQHFSMTTMGSECCIAWKAAK